MYKVLCYRLYDSKKKKEGNWFHINYGRKGSFYLTFKSLDEMAKFVVQTPSIRFRALKGDHSVEEIRAFKQKVLAISRKIAN